MGIGVEEMLNLDWQGEPDPRAQQHRPQPLAHYYVAPQHMVPQVFTPQHMPPPAVVEPQLSVIDNLTQNIAEIRDSIRDLKQGSTAGQTIAPAQDPLMLVSDALLALTKGQKRVAPSTENEDAEEENVSDKKKQRMQRNRQSAHDSRERKRLYTESLEDRLLRLSQENAAHIATVQELRQM